MYFFEIISLIYLDVRKFISFEIKKPINFKSLGVVRVLTISLKFVF